jgi:hypothetical protein
VRSRQEIQFRLRQELGNLAMWVCPPRSSRAPNAGETQVPDLRDTPYTRDLIATADSVLRHHFPILGITIDAGPEIDWRRDYLHKISTSAPYFRRVPYLDFGRVGDHKVVWELNRHQHLVLLAQAFRLTGRHEYLDEAFRQLESWIRSNPFLRGINWASALEVAFRSLSWIWLWRLAGDQMPPEFAPRFLDELYRHGAFLERNLSIYFSPNTHLLGEAVALHALGVLFDRSGWRTTGGQIVEEAMERQVRDDGSHFEQSAYYHVYALDFFLFHATLAEPSPGYLARLERMAEYLDALLGPSSILPLFGDDDGGRLFHPYGDRTRFGRATMAACAVFFGRGGWLRSPDDLYEIAAWWTAAPAPEPAPAHHISTLFRDAGVAVLAHDQTQIVIKAGGFGEGSGGHSHSDVLGIIARTGDREILIDPGTYTYVASPADRNTFRGSAAHSTIRIDGRDQAIPAGPFRWNEKPSVEILEWNAAPQSDTLDAVCSYGGFRHQRRVEFRKPAKLLVTDVVHGPSGEHTVEAFWHLGSAECASRFQFSAPAQIEPAWRSRALFSKEPSQRFCVKVSSTLPVRVETEIDLS